MDSDYRLTFEFLHVFHMVLFIWTQTKAGTVGAV